MCVCFLCDDIYFYYCFNFEEKKTCKKKQKKYGKVTVLSPRLLEYRLIIDFFSC